MSHYWGILVRDLGERWPLEKTGVKRIRRRTRRHLLRQTDWVDQLTRLHTSGQSTRSPPMFFANREKIDQPHVERDKAASRDLILYQEPASLGRLDAWTVEKAWYECAPHVEAGVRKLLGSARRHDRIDDYSGPWMSLTNTDRVNGEMEEQAGLERTLIRELHLARRRLMSTLGYKNIQRATQRLRYVKSRVPPPNTRSINVVWEPCPGEMAEMERELEGWRWLCAGYVRLSELDGGDESDDTEMPLLISEDEIHS
ncbi:hypothetical protein B0H11DRAFT_1931337 [Mycena galericulata]|nr:hypothetical protein B0H11DRAFT_1931337 [Mycena galericulata]